MGAATRSGETTHNGPAEEDAPADAVAGSRKAATNVSCLGGRDGGGHDGQRRPGHSNRPHTLLIWCQRGRGLRDAKEEGGLEGDSPSAAAAGTPGPGGWAAAGSASPPSLASSVSPKEALRPH